MKEEWNEREETVNHTRRMLAALEKLAPEIQDRIQAEYGSMEHYTELCADAAAMADLLERLSKRPPREHLIVFLRFGLIDGRPRTREEVTARFGISVERLRCIEDRCLRPCGIPLRRRKRRIDFLEE